MSALFLPVFYGSYRRDRQGIRFAEYAVRALEARGNESTLVDAKAADLPMLDRMYKEYQGDAPDNMEAVARILRRADGFVFVAGEYNWGVQPGLKNLMDHYLEEWFWRPAAILTYSAGRLGGAHANFALQPTLSEMGMAVVTAGVQLGNVGQAFDGDGHPAGDGAKALVRSFEKAAATLEWWADVAREGRVSRSTPF